MTGLCFAVAGQNGPAGFQGGLALGPGCHQLLLLPTANFVTYERSLPPSHRMWCRQGPRCASVLQAGSVGFMGWTWPIGPRLPIAGLRQSTSPVLKLKAFTYSAGTATYRRTLVLPKGVQTPAFVSTKAWHSNRHKASFHCYFDWRVVRFLSLLHKVAANRM